jgi:hypothetical protein
MDYVKMLTKGILGFLVGLVAVGIMGMAQAFSNYNPVVCTDVITTNCTTQLVSTAYYAIVPAIVAGLTALANFLKHKNDPVA